MNAGTIRNFKMTVKPYNSFQNDTTLYNSEKCFHSYMVIIRSIKVQIFIQKLLFAYLI